MSKTEIAYMKKALVALAAAIGAALSAGLIPHEYAAWVSTALAFLGALGVYVVPNKTDVVEAEATDTGVAPASATVTASQDRETGFKEYDTQQEAALDGEVTGDVTEEGAK